MKKWIWFLLLLSFQETTFAQKYSITKKNVSFEFFEKQGENLKSKYSCEYSQKTELYKFLLKTLEIESSELEDLSKSNILSIESIVFLEEQLLAKTKVISKPANIICIQDDKAFVFHKEISNRFGMLSISEYSFITEDRELKLVIPRDVKDKYWYSMSNPIHVEIYYRIGIANK